jgi:methyl-accepting chemotaxis protein
MEDFSLKIISRLDLKACFTGFFICPSLKIRPCFLPFFRLNLLVGNHKKGKTMFTNLKIRYKLRIVAYSQALIIILLLGFVFSLTSKLNQNVESILSTNSKISLVRNITLDIKDYFTNEQNFESVKSNYNYLLDSLEGYENLNELKKIWQDVEKYEEITKANNGIIKEVMDLTDNSILQSNTYINNVSQKLANPSTKNAVSTLERLVIIGANVNTSANYQIKVLFYKLVSDLTVKDELISFLDKSIENASTDVERLKNTPFAQLPVVALENNRRIKELATSFISNINETHAIHEDVRNNITDFIYQLNDDNIQSINNNNGTLKTYISILLVILIIASIFLVMVNITVSNSITKAFYSFTKNFNELAEGNLLAQSSQAMLNRGDELGDLARARKKMLEKLKSIINEVKVGATAIAAAGKQLNTSAQHISQGSNQQASSSEEISASMEQMAANIAQNNDNAKETKEVSLKATEQMKQLSSSASESLSAIDKISDKISIINDIAFQTNILALNAAVEAARAGELGKGFAVVASEVRKLAERSKASANEIEALSQSSVKVTHETKKLLSELLPDIEKTSTLIQEIANASAEQDAGVGQVNTAIDSLNDISQQNAGISEELASSAEQLSTGALELERVISYFKTDENELKRQYKIPLAEKRIEKEVPKTKNTSLPESIVKITPKKADNSGIMLDLGKSDFEDADFESF